MTKASYSITGMDRLQRHIKTLSEPKKIFDPDYQKATRFGVRDLVDSTPKKTGMTRRTWTTPLRLGLSNYLIQDKLSSSGVSVARIIDEGRGVVVPKKSKRLFIPLSTRGMAKKPGQPIPKGFVFGEDYVLAKQSKAVAARPFIQKSTNRTSRELVRYMITTIRRVHSGS